jgi:predicted transcriptional regulator
VRDTDGPSGKISRIYWLLQARLKEKISPYSIRIMQYSILRYLYKHDGTSQERIAPHLKIDKALCSREVRKLEKAGFFVRKRDEKDSRKQRGDGHRYFPRRLLQIPLALLLRGGMSIRIG